jgi:hypothetical protein
MRGARYVRLIPWTLHSGSEHGYLDEYGYFSEIVSPDVQWGQRNSLMEETKIKNSRATVHLT